MAARPRLERRPHISPNFRPRSMTTHPSQWGRPHVLGVVCAAYATVSQANVRKPRQGSAKPHRVDRRQVRGDDGPAVTAVVAGPQATGSGAHQQAVAGSIDHQSVAVGQITAVLARQADAEGLEAAATVARAVHDQRAVDRNALLVGCARNEPGIEWMADASQPPPNHSARPGWFHSGSFSCHDSPHRPSRTGRRARCRPRPCRSMNHSLARSTRRESASSHAGGWLALGLLWVDRRRDFMPCGVGVV